MVDFEELKKKILSMPGVQGVSVEGGRIIVFSDTVNVKSVDGVPVTCLRAGKPHTMELRMQSSLVSVRREMWRPLPGGVSVADAYNTAGTYGMKVKYQGEDVMLSNSHIFTKVGFPVVQPSPSDGGDLRKDYIGTVIKATDINTTTLGLQEGINTVDAALSSSDVVLSDNILDIGVVNDYTREDPKMLQTLTKSGRDGTTHGRVIARNGSFKISYTDLGEAVFDGLIVTTAMAKPGSSGSIGVSNRKAVGLLFAGSEEVTLFIPMQKVVEKMGIEIG